MQSDGNSTKEGRRFVLWEENETMGRLTRCNGNKNREEDLNGERGEVSRHRRITFNRTGTSKSYRKIKRRTGNALLDPLARRWMVPSVKCRREGV